MAVRLTSAVGENASENISAKGKFDAYLQATFPSSKKRSRSAVIHRVYGERIVNHLRGSMDTDKHFRHLVTQSGFRLLDLPAAGLRDALVVSVKEGLTVVGIECQHDSLFSIKKLLTRSYCFMCVDMHI